MTTQEFIDAIKAMSVMELNDLVKACEEEFGVSAAAGVVVAAAGAGEAAAAEEKDSFDVELTSAGDSKVKVIIFIISHFFRLVSHFTNFYRKIFIFFRKNLNLPQQKRGCHQNAELLNRYAWL